MAQAPVVVPLAPSCPRPQRRVFGPVHTQHMAGPCFDVIALAARVAVVVPRSSLSSWSPELWCVGLLFLRARVTLVPPRSNPRTLHCKAGLLTTGPPGGPSALCFYAQRAFRRWMECILCFHSPIGGHQGGVRLWWWRPVLPWTGRVCEEMSAPVDRPSVRGV